MMLTEYVIVSCYCRDSINCTCDGDADGDYTKRQADEKIRTDPSGIKYVAKKRWSRDGDLLMDVCYWDNIRGYDQ